MNCSLRETSTQSLSEYSPTSIDGWRIRLDPMKMEDAQALLEIGRDERIWTYMARGPLESREDAEEFVRQALAGQDRGTDAAFVIRLKDSETIIGTARYLVMDPVHNSLEVGWVFFDPKLHRRYFVQEACYLLIAYAFECLSVDRVWFKTDNRNLAAKKAMDYMGLKREGVLRKHLRVRNGFIRDSSIHSYISDEWGECGPKFRARVIEAIGRDVK